MNADIIKWLLVGDVSIQYQVNRDLLNNDSKKLQAKISEEGWGHKLLSFQRSDGHWGRGFYQPKWTSTHYTLLELKNLCISPTNKNIRKIIRELLNNEMSGQNIVSKDICINGMVLNYSSYFKADESELKTIIDYIINNQMADGGFNCQSTRKGSVHSSLHTTLSVLEGINEYKTNGFRYKLTKLKKIEKDCIEFILIHKLFKSDKTGKTINNNFIRIPHPPRWKYDILRCLDYFQSANVKYDVRIQDAIDLLISKRKPNGFWQLQAKHPGKIHFEMEKAGQPSRWNTLRALRVLKHFDL